MKQSIAQIALLVEDYDEAIKFYTEKLHFTLVEDTVLSAAKRWVVVAPKGAVSVANDHVGSRQTINKQYGGIHMLG